MDGIIDNKSILLISRRNNNFCHDVKIFVSEIHAQGMKFLNISLPVKFVEGVFRRLIIFHRIMYMKSSVTK